MLEVFPKIFRTRMGLGPIQGLTTRGNEAQTPKNPAMKSEHFNHGFLEGLFWQVCTVKGQILEIWLPSVETPEKATARAPLYCTALLPLAIYWSEAIGD